MAVVTPTPNTGTGALPMTPEAELAKLQTDSTYGGGTYYGRTPNGIADLVKGGVVQPTGDSQPTPKGSNSVGTQGQWVTDPATGQEKFVPAGSNVDTTIASSGVRRYTGSGTPGTSSYDVAAGDTGTPPPAPDTNAIRAAALADAENEINGIKQTFAAQVAQAQTEGVANLGKGRATEARGGILGSDFGNAQQDTIQKGTDTKVAAINAQMNAAIAAVTSRATLRGDTLAQQAVTEADKKNTNYLASLKDHRDQSQKDVVSLAKAGVPLSSLTQDEYNKLIDATGYQPAVFDAVYNANLPANQKRTYTYQKLADGTILPVSVNPATNMPEAGTPLTPPKSASGTAYDGFQVLPDGTPIFYNKTTGEAKVAGIEGTTDTNFAKPATPAKTPVTPAAKVAADKLGGAWLKQQADYSPEFQKQYETDAVFHAKVNAAAAAAVKPSSSKSSGGRTL